MGRAPCCSKVGLHRGPWTPREDTLLTKYIQAHGEGHWRSLPKKAGLLRCGKSCRLRWMNYLRPDIKRGNITPDEDDLIIRLHSLLGNRWSLIAGRLPGRTDNEIKNYWNTYLSKRLREQGTDPNTHKKLPEPYDAVQQTNNNKRKNKNKKNNNNKPRTTSNNNKRKIKEREEASPAAEKPKIHLPKPVRVSSLTMSRNYSFEGNSSSQEKGEGLFGDEAEVPWLNFKEDQNEVFLMVNNNGGSELECESTQLLTHDTSLEKLYEEYLGLLKIDDGDQFELESFAESLLI
ncbi:hypothetical protein UlMin_021746 [Ulmus minor]